MPSGQKPESRTGVRERLRRLLRTIRDTVGAVRAALHRLRQRLPSRVKRLIRRVTRVSLHSLNGVLITVVLLFVLAWLWLPTLADRKPDIENLLASTLGSPVQIEQLDTFWDGLNPGVQAKGFRVGATAQDPVLRLRELRLSLAWWPLLTGRIVINQLVVVEPHLVVEHRVDGRFRLTGIDIATGTQPETGPQDLGAWLLRQRELVIEDGTIEWIDRQPADRQAEHLTIRRVHAQLVRDGNRHRFDLRAEFPSNLCGECRISADLRGSPLDPSQDWSGELRLEARELRLAAVPRLLHARLPAGLDGRFDVQLDSRWRDGWPEIVRGRISASELTVPLPGMDRPLALRQVNSPLEWRGDRHSGRLDLARLSLDFGRAPWLAGRTRLEYATDRSRLDIEHVDVGDVGAFLAGLDQRGRAMDWLRAARPAGSVDRLRATLDGPLTQPHDFKLSAELRELRFAAHERLPGLSALSGRLKATRRGGEFRIEAGPNRLELPRVFRAPLDIQRLESVVSWRQEAEHWLVRAADIEAQARDGRVRGDVELRLPSDAAQSPVIKLDMAVSDGVVEHAARYYPLILPEALRVYLERAVVGGRLTAGSVHLHGALRNFPFRDGKGRLEVRAHVSGGEFAYLPGWEPIRQIEADLQFTGTGMLITASSGTLRGLQVGRVVTAIDDYIAPGGAVVTANGRVSGPLADVLGVLADSKSPTFAPYLWEGLSATGTGVLTLDLRIPARRPAGVVIAGDYRLEDGGLALPFRAIHADGLRGRLGFTHAGLQDGEVKGRLLGGDTRVVASPADGEGGGTRLAAHGMVSQSGLEQLFGAGLVESLRGSVPWKAQLLLGRGFPEWQLESELDQLEISLPAPLAKARNESLPLTLRSLPSGDARRILLGLEMAGRVSGRLALRREGAGWQFERGRIGVGERVSQLPEQAGLHLSMRLPDLNIDPWWKLLRHDIKNGGGTGWFDYVNRLSAEVDALEVFGRPFGQVSVNVARHASHWRGRLQGESAAGEIVYLPSGCARAADCPPLARGGQAVADPRPAVHVTLERLAWPAARPDAPPAATDPRKLPVLTLKAGDFSAMGRTFGALDLSGEPVRQGWRISHLGLNQPEASLAAKGTWEVDWQEKQSSHFTLTLNSRDFGATLTRLGYPDELVGGRLNVSSRWSWPGTPGDFSLAGVDGELTVLLSDGRLPKISPGAGRLLGVLDLRSLTRYLSLDLSSVFGTGMSFDSVKGRLEIGEGNAYTRGLEVRAPGADLEMAGRIGIVRRDLDLHVKVTPRLMEELAITGGLIGGPAVGAAVALLHSLARKPFETSTRVSYTVKGSWDEPTVKRLGGPDLPAPEEQP